MKIMTPTIHLNGSNAESLKGEYMAAYEAAQDLLLKLSEIDLNARDYYVQANPLAFQIACTQSVARYQAVKNIRNELEQIIMAIQDQQ
jgi:hypothetical protein